MDFSFKGFSEAAFKETEIMGLMVKNRFIRAPTWLGMADDGFVTDALIDSYSCYAEGGVGLIHTEFAYVSDFGRRYSTMLGVSRDEYIEGLRELVDAVHKAGARISCQIVHCGANSDPNLSPDGNAYAPSSILTCTLGAEKMGLYSGGRKPKKMSREDIAQVVKEFGSAARRVMKAGFDAVEIHAAHFYLLSEFLSPFYNRRTDEYGGSLENRTRILLEVVDEVRKIVGENFPVLVRLNCEDFIDEGLVISETVQMAMALEDHSVDSIDVSGGNAARKVETLEDEAYFKDYTKKIRGLIQIPVMLTGGIRSPEVVYNLLKNGYTDFVGFSRPLIAEPDLINRWRLGDLRKALCTSCNECLNKGRKGKGVRCLVF